MCSPIKGSNCESQSHGWRDEQICLFSTVQIKTIAVLGQGARPERDYTSEIRLSKTHFHGKLDFETMTLQLHRFAILFF
jgi:hypothetical protein